MLRPFGGEPGGKERCNARTRSGHPCSQWVLPGKTRCLWHGGASSGARSEDGRARQRKGYRRYVLRLRGQGLKPGPRKDTGGRPNKKRDMLDSVEQQRLAVIAALEQE